MTYGEFKKTKKYRKASDIYLCVNGEESIDEMYYPEELDHLEVVGVGYRADGELLIDLVCNNWDCRHEIGWVAE